MGILPGFEFFRSYIWSSVSINNFVIITGQDVMVDGLGSVVPKILTYRICLFVGRFSRNSVVSFLPIESTTTYHKTNQLALPNMSETDAPVTSLEFAWVCRP